MIINHQWDYYNPVINKIRESITSSNSKKIVEIGASNRHFDLATDFIGLESPPFELQQNQIFKKINISKERLPYENKEVDYIFARHVIEDIYNPIEVCREMMRVAKAGYIETPSPVVEVSRHVGNIQRPFYRGYIHHRYFIWVYNNILNILPKLPHFEYFLFDDLLLHSMLNKDHLYWGSYLMWDDNFEIKEHNLDYNHNTGMYYDLIKLSINESIKDNNKLNRLLFNEIKDK